MGSVETGSSKAKWSKKEESAKNMEDVLQARLLVWNCTCISSAHTYLENAIKAIGK